MANFVLSHDAQDIDDTIDEVQEARGSEASLSARLADIVSDFETDQQRQETEIGVVAALGAKNPFNIDATPVVNHTDFTLVSGKLTVTANGNWAHYSVPLSLPAGDYILSTAISGYSKAAGAPDTSMRLRMSATTSGGTNIVLQTVTGNGTMSVPFSWTGGQIYLQFYSDYNGTSYANSFAAENTMIRRAEITDDTFAPYAPTNRELYETEQQQDAVIATKITMENILGAGRQITDTAGQDALTLGKFYCANASDAGNVSTAPWSTAGYFGFTMRSISSSQRFAQIAIRNDDSFAIAKRRYTGSWQPWAYITGTAPASLMQAGRIDAELTDVQEVTGNDT